MLTFTVIEIAPQDGYAILRVQVGSDSPDITTGDTFNLAVTRDIAEMNEVGRPLAVSD
jgi:hypothetical protein